MRPLTKNRAKLLNLFFTNPERAFYMQEIGRIVGKKPGIFQRTLNSMVIEGILQSEYKANARYFKADKNYPLYKELKSIVFKTVGVQGSIKDALGKIKGIRNAFIYGSFAKDEASVSSDIDLFIIGRIDENKLIREIGELEKILQREINYNLYSKEEFYEKRKAKDSFILDLLEKPKMFLIGEKNDL